jgi:thioredoxin-related protein
MLTDSAALMKVGRMLRLLLPFFLIAAGAGSAQGESPVASPYAIDIPKWFTESFLDVKEDIREAAREDKRLLIYFGQDGCPYCKALMKVNFTQPDIVATTRRNFTPIALNIWGDREVTWVDGRKVSEKELAKILRVQYTPTLVFFDEEGHVVLRLNGYYPPEKMRPALAYVSQRLEKQQSFTDYLAGVAPEKGDARLASQPFFARGTPDLPRLLKSGKPALAVFERAPCRDCAEMHREGFARPEVKGLLAGFKVVQVDVLGSRSVVTPEGKSGNERDWARALQIVNTPSLVFFDPAGKEVFRAEGYLRPFHLASALEYVASGAYRGEPSFQRFVQKRADAQRAAGKTVDLWR